MNKKTDNERRPARIAYLLEDFLTPTTTFITQEVQYLYSQGHDIQVYVTGNCITSEIDPAVADLFTIAQFSRPTNAKAMVLSHLRALVQCPRKYVNTVWKMLRMTWDKPGYCIRSMRYFLEGIYLGRKMIDGGVVWVHAHFAGRAATAAWSIWNVYGIPYSVTTHAYDLFADYDHSYNNRPRSSSLSNRNLGSLQNSKLEGAQVIITISEFNRAYLTDKLKIGADKIRVVRCGVDTSRFRRESQPISEISVILSVGGLVEKKGHDVLLRACANLKEWGYQFSCKIIGEGPLLENLLALKKSLRLENYVHFCGRVHHSEIPKYHKEADVFALACVKGDDGNMDGIPVAIMEAMAMEIPVVTTEISGIPELVESGRTGFVVQPGNPEVLAEKIKQLLDDARLRLIMGKLGREKILKDYNQAQNHSVFVNSLFERMARKNISVRS